MILSLLLAAALAAPKPLPTVVSAAPLGTDSIALYHLDGSLTVCSPLSIIVLDARPNAFGMPSSIATDDAAGLPHSYETEYSSNAGTHHVRTPCSGYANLRECAEAHKRAVDALQTVFPKV